MIRAVFFDAGNTLIHPHPGVAHVCAEVFQRHGLNATVETLFDAVQAAESFYEERYKTDDSFWASETRAEDFWIAYYTNVARCWGADGEVGTVAKDVYDEFGKGARWRLYEDAVATLTELKSRGLTLGVISNWDTRLPEILLSLGVGHFFDFIVSSARVGFIKPQAEIFELALGRASVEPFEALHVGDHFYADVLGARSVGLTPVLMDRVRRHPTGGCLCVSTLSQIIELIAD